MNQIQDKLKVLSDSTVIAGEESGLAVKNFFSSMARWQKVVFFAGVILIIPGYFAAYYSSQTIVKSHNEKNLLQAHSALGQAKPISATSITVLKVAPNQYTAYFQVTNNNLDLAAPNIPYSIDFFNAAGEKIYTSQGNFFLLADQKKYIVVPRIDNREEIASGKLSITEIKWQKRLAVPQVSFKTPKPDLYDQTFDSSQLIAEGSVVNDSAYTIKTIKITFLLYNRSGQIVGVNVRDEGNLVPFGRRAYKQSWPNLAAGDISKVEVNVDVNTLDQSNLIFTSSQPVPASNNPDLN
jgi:hypothetical protein